MQSHVQHLVVKAAVMTEVKQNLPRLHNFAGLHKVFKIGPDSNQRIGWIVWRWILAKKISSTQCYPHCNTLIWLRRILLKIEVANVSFCLFELGWVCMKITLVLELWVHGANVSKSVDGIFFERLRFIPCHVVYHFLLQKCKA